MSRGFLFLSDEGILSLTHSQMQYRETFGRCQEVFENTLRKLLNMTFIIIYGFCIQSKGEVIMIFNVTKYFLKFYLTNSEFCDIL